MWIFYVCKCVQLCVRMRRGNYLEYRRRLYMLYLVYVYVVTTLRSLHTSATTTVKNCNHMKSLFSGILRIQTEL